MISQTVRLPAEVASRLENLDALAGLARVSGNLVLGFDDPNNSLDGCVGHAGLATLDGLHGLESVGGDVLIGCNPALDRAPE